MRKILGALLLTITLSGCGFGCSLNAAVFDEQSNVLASADTTDKHISISYAQLKATHGGNSTPELRPGRQRDTPSPFLCSWTNPR